MTNSEDTPNGHKPKAGARPSDTSELAARIAKAQAARRAQTEAQNGSRQDDMTGLARGLRIGAEFVAAILVGSGIGYLIDQFAGTTPWALLIMFMVGFAAGVLNVTRVVAELNAKNAAGKPDAED
ncbi:AtpZ/AtpI family protein [Pelagibacterium xiamenense]|uniref:AtpZ/AtpI family protein n=1 Tax=Pelagibacterium xiamenense TaxID=2901140 RepID=UPI001E3AAA2E|nr:AtpZ/AtpI family protein [Pelagibacterium xiamenense]